MKIQALVAALLTGLISPSAFAISSGFTYQGSLVDVSAPADGSYDLKFTLQTTAGTPVGLAIVRDDVVVSDGAYKVELDFGPVIAIGDYQLQIAMRPGASSGAFIDLSPANRITPVPQAQVAEVAQVATSVLNNSIGSAQIIPSQVQMRVAASCPTGHSIRAINANGSVACESVAAGFVGPKGSAGTTGATGSAGTAGTNLPTGALGLPEYWSISGNSGTNSKIHFVGTTDKQTLVFRANNLRIGELTPRGSVTDYGDAPSVAFGSSANEATAIGATVGGGGATRADGSTYGNHKNSALGIFATISGGKSHVASGQFSAIGGGLSNTASGDSSTVSGGKSNEAVGSHSTLSGGAHNETNGSNSTVSGGTYNSADGENGTVIGGYFNQASGEGTTASGGVGNCAGGDNSWVGGTAAKTRPGTEAGDGNCAPDSGTVDGDVGTFVWADGQSYNGFISTGPHQFLVRAKGGVAINTNAPTPGSSLTVNGPMSFGAQAQQMLNLYNGTYGIGVQNSRMYFRTNSGFSWFEDGVHSDATDNPGAGGTLRMRLSSNGQLQTTTGTLSTLSDNRLKDQVQEYSHALDQINALRPVRYHYRDAGKAAFQSEGLHLGFIAQEVQQVFPEWVSEGEDGYLMLSMRGFEAVAVRAMQELSTENALLRAKLETDTAALETRVAALESRLIQQSGEFQARLDALETGLNRQ